MAPLYRYKVQREIESRKKSSILRKSTSWWWKTINTLSGRSEKKTGFSLQRNGKQLTDDELVNSLNSFFTRVNADIPPLDLNCLTSYLPVANEIPIVEQYDVCIGSF